MPSIPLTRGHFALVDDADMPQLSQFRWHASFRRYTRKDGTKVEKIYAHTLSRGNRVAMQNLLMNPPEGYEVDHINGNGVDNRRENLRVCTHQENARNQRRPGKYGYQGVRRTRYGKFKGMVTLSNQKNVWSKPFDTIIEAAHERDRMAIAYFGEFANLNFPESRHASEESEKPAAGGNAPCPTCKGEGKVTDNPAGGPRNGITLPCVRCGGRGMVDAKSSSGFAGVYRHDEKWCYDLRRGERRFRKYGFETAEDAARGRDAKIAELSEEPEQKGGAK